MIDNVLKSKVHQFLIHKTEFIKVKDRMTDDQLRIFVDNAITEMCEDQKVEVPTEERIGLIKEIVSGVTNLGPIRRVMEDDTVSEIMINGYDRVYIQQAGKISLADIKFDSNNHLSHTIQKLLGMSGTSRRVDESSPYVDFSLPDGSRINVIVPPCSVKGPIVTIRKFSATINTVDDLIKLKMFDQKSAALLRTAMKAKLNIVFCGATGTGKTTTLNVFSRHIPEHERIVTIEDTPELRLLQEHVVTLQSKDANIEGRGAISIRDLFINSLRMRPDRIIIGEVRSDEMLDLIQSISSGHSGSLAIVHADSPQDCFDRMVSMTLMSGIQLSTPEIQKQIARAIDLIVYIELYSDGVRRLANITDLYYDNEKKEPVLRDILTFEQDSISEEGKISGHWKFDPARPSFYKKYEKKNVKLPEGFQQ